MLLVVVINDRPRGGRGDGMVVDGLGVVEGGPILAYSSLASPSLASLEKGSKGAETSHFFHLMEPILLPL